MNTARPPLLSQLDLNIGLNVQPSCKVIVCNPTQLICLLWVFIPPLNLYGDMVMFAIWCLVSLQKYIFPNYWPQCLQLWWSGRHLVIRYSYCHHPIISLNPCCRRKLPHHPVNKYYSVFCRNMIQRSSEPDNTSLFVYRHDLAQVSGLIYVVTLDNIFEMRHLVNTLRSCNVKV